MAKAKPEWQRLIERCQRLWTAYDKAPTKANLEKFGAHLEKMKGSKSAKVKAERNCGARAFRQQWKAAGYHMPAKRKPAKRKNPRLKRSENIKGWVSLGANEWLKDLDDQTWWVGFENVTDMDADDEFRYEYSYGIWGDDDTIHKEVRSLEPVEASGILDLVDVHISNTAKRNPDDLNKKEMAAIYFTRRGTSRSNFIKKFSEQLYKSLVKKGYLGQKEGALDLTEKGYDVKRAILEDLYQETSEETAWSEVTDDPIGLEDQFGGRSTDARTRGSHMRPWDNPKRKPAKRKPAKRKAAKKKATKRNPAGRRVAITQDELAEMIARRIHGAGRAVTSVSVGEWLEAFRYEDHFGAGVRSAANRIGEDNHSRFIAKVRKAVREEARHTRGNPESKRNPDSLSERWPFMGNKAEGTMTVEKLEAIADPNISLKRLAVKDADHIEKLKEDIRIRGFVNPVIIKKGRGIAPFILDGHHRVIAARQLGIKEVPVMYYMANPGKSKRRAKRNPADSWKMQRGAIAEKYGLDKFQASYHPKDQHLSVDLISVPKQGRGEGRASMAMRDTLDWADANGVTVTVSPTSEFGSSKGRLEKWYLSMGFVPNKGRNKDFRFTDSMLRIPMASNPRKAKRKVAKRNPIHHSPRHEQEIHVLDEAGWHVILEPSSIEGPDEAGINAVKLVDPDNGDYYALITRSARDPGKWQSTRFDERGPVGHSTKDTLIDAVNDTRKWYGLTVSEVVKKNPGRKARR